MEQQRAVNALEPYLALSKNARTPASAADLVKQATSDPHTYIFVELLQTPNIQSLRNDNAHARHLTLLEIFAWGTWNDYQTTTNLPQLNDNQTRKLKLLSLISLLSNPANPAVASTKENLSYGFLQKELEMPSQADLEKLLTSALSSGLITGHLDPLHKLVAVTSVAPLRDLPPGSAVQLVSVLGEWEDRCDSTLKELDAQMQAVRDNAHKRGERERARKAAFEKEVGEEGEGGDDDASKKLRAKRKEPGGRGGDAMDLDDENGKHGLRSGAAKAKKLFSKGR